MNAMMMHPIFPLSKAKLSEPLKIFISMISMERDVTVQMRVHACSRIAYNGGIVCSELFFGEKVLFVVHTS
jgi:hypothetical protein